MIKAALLIARKDLTLMLARGPGLAQALMLGALLVFLFSLSAPPGALLPPQGAATVFWLGSVFCQVLIFNSLFALEEENNAREGLLLAPTPPQAIWLGKAFAGFLLIVAAQVIFIPAVFVFLGQDARHAGTGLAAIMAADIGLAASGSLLGALSRGQAARESLLSLIIFPLLIPALLAAIRLGAAALGAPDTEDQGRWFGILLSFDALFLATGLILFPFVYEADD